MIGAKIDNTWVLDSHMNKVRSSNVAICTRSVGIDEVI